ncbi:ABC transporter substrate-binding protein [Virgibacillus halophilus]|uniref:ABC transporter substrate-binding protein n=1 Tax=Tigheibacillus halophilus TaxID=361280 RepID=A0ABU5C5N9_9BACI|nr:ABC transporter substrate-binding protein [Virgibacillus halophilus]
MKKKTWLSLLAIFCSLLFVVAACSNDTGSKGDNKDKAEAEGSGASGDKTLVFGRGTDSIQLDPSKVTDGESLNVTIQIYDTLVKYKQEDTEVQPSLATEWNVSDDGKKWTFKLRDDVKFHDGNDFTAEDVVYNFERWATSADFIYYGYMFGATEDNLKGIIDKVEATDKYEVTFTLSEPNAPFLYTLAMSPFGIASPKAIEKYGDDYFKNPVGTGPFVFEEWVPDDKITLKKNGDYFGDVAKLDQVVFKTIPDNGARFMELQAGTIDLMNGLNPQDIQTVEGDDNLQIIRRPSMNVAYMAMNTDKDGPMAEKKSARRSIWRWIRSS